MANPILKVQNCKASFGDYKRVVYWCSGCKSIHTVAVEGKQHNGANWSWNGSMEKPTFQPSVLSTYETPTMKRVCHTYITDGVVNFLDDCTHEFKGQHVPLEPLPDWVLGK